ncbi:hypothetical protein HRR86_009133 [Exophiala dermatitidis]|nr:hypothetical protein HRR85_008991 [Exophiala dermatitidis]KAJ4611598.1 hypothetical protein HRR86_009133 [Exophiala dermatitidis]
MLATEAVSSSAYHMNRPVRLELRKSRRQTSCHLLFISNKKQPSDVPTEPARVATNVGAPRLTDNTLFNSRSPGKCSPPSPTTDVSTRNIVTPIANVELYP